MISNDAWEHLRALSIPFMPLNAPLPPTGGVQCMCYGQVGAGYLWVEKGPEIIFSEDDLECSKKCLQANPPPLSLSRTEIISRMHDNVLYLQNNITHAILDVRGSNTKGGNQDFLQHHCYLVQLFGEKCGH